MGLKEQLLCTFKHIADLNDLALNMYQNIAHYPIYSNTIVQGYLEELKWIKHFSLNYGHGGTMRYQYLILKSLLNQIENTAGVTVSSPMTLDNMEILWRFEGSTANNTSATTKIETAVGQLIQNLIVLANNPLYTKEISDTACHCLGALGVYTTHKFHPDSRGINSSLKVSSIASHIKKTELDRITCCVNALHNPYSLNPSALVSAAYTLQLFQNQT